MSLSSGQYKEVTSNQIASALNFLDCNCNYSEWIKSGMAIHSWSAGNDGFCLWDNWSSYGSKYKKGETATHWRSFKKGSISIASLFHAAKSAGWGYKTNSNITAYTVKKDSPNKNFLMGAKQQEAISTPQELKTAEEKFDNFLLTYHKTSRRAPSDHPYLEKKNVKPHDLRAINFKSNENKEILNSLVIPAFNIINETAIKDDSYALGVQTLQFICPNGFKMNYPGRPISGCFYLFYGVTETVYLCEGWATGASLYEITEATVAVCFSCNNLSKAAVNIKKLYPYSKFIVAADNNKDGIKYGKKTAKLIGGTLTYPPTESTDFNDYISSKKPENKEN